MSAAATEQQSPIRPGEAFTAKVLFDYAAVETSELSVVAGDIVEIEEVNASGWALAKNAAQQSGWLPADYVERVDSGSSSSASNSSAFSTASSSASASSSSSDPTADINDALKKLRVASTDPATGSARVCAGCGEAISSAFVLAKDAAFHPTHFTCTVCHCELGGRSYMEQDGKFYCEDDYYVTFNPKCAACNELIKGPYISALDASWHPDHFVCTVCRAPFADNQFRKHDGKPYCDEHFAERCAHKCARCQKPILGQVFEAVDKKWHLDCFTCQHDGHRVGEGQPFHVIPADKAKGQMEDEIWCPAHYELKFLEKCNVCQQPIKGQYIKVSNKQLHSECWRCFKCKSQLRPENAAVDPATSNFICKTCLGKQQAESASSKPAPAVGSTEAKAAAKSTQLEARKSEILAASSSSSTPAPAASFADPKTKTYTYDALKDKDKKPADVDPAKKEQYLTEPEFHELFKMGKQEFDKLPAWKKEALKKPLGLF